MHDKKHPAQVELLIAAARAVLTAFVGNPNAWGADLLAELERQVVAAERARSKQPADDEAADDLRLHGSTMPRGYRGPGSVMEGVLAVADQAGLDGVVFTAETLRGMADDVTKFYDEERGALMYRGPTLPAPTDDLQAMRRDAARYEWLRERWGCLVSTWNTRATPKELTSIDAPDFRGWSVIDPSTLDRAIDAAMDREDAKGA